MFSGAARGGPVGRIRYTATFYKILVNIRSIEQT